MDRRSRTTTDVTADPIATIEAVYAEAPSDSDWLHGVVASAASVLDPELALIAYTFELGPHGPPRILDSFVHGSHSERYLETSHRMIAEAGEAARDGFASQVSLLSEVIGPPIASDFLERHLGYLGEPVDCLGIVGHDPSGGGAVVSAAVPAGWKLVPAFRRRWRYLTAHLATGFRLRRRSGAPADEAILDLGGKLYDASGEAKSREARVVLRQAVRAIDRARANRKKSPDEAVAGWQALVRARWSLVDRFDSDGRTFVIAKPNPPSTPPRRPLTPRETAVVSLAALGRSNKLIAYELGVSVGSVGNYLVRAAKKLGVHSRADLLRAYLAAMGPRGDEDA
jgi:DNA-binding CsgD family transcriptional regulator